MDDDDLPKVSSFSFGLAHYNYSTATVPNHASFKPSNPIIEYETKPCTVSIRRR